jgi:hypothetical protein
MKPQPGKPGKLATLTAAWLLLAVPVVVFWRDGFFYIIDDWTTLIQIVENPFGQYLLMPDCENWFPFFHLIYYFLAKAAGEHYTPLVLVNCLATGVNAFLLYLFFRRLFSYGPALVLSLFYAGAALQHVSIWNFYYLCYIMCLGFFLGALLLTDDYVRSPSRTKLLGLGLCAALSIMSHNYILVGLVSLPLYALLLGGEEGRRRAWPLALTVGVLYLCFALGYWQFAGREAATTHNRLIFLGLPGVNYFIHFFYAVFLSPFYYMFWGHYHFPVWDRVAGITLLIGCIATVWRWGGGREGRLVLWGLLFNALPFLLISLARHQKSVNQAFGPRYGLFTLMGALILVGTAWSLLAARATRRRWFQALTLGVLAAMVWGQLAALPRWHELYLDMSRAARDSYGKLTRADDHARVVPEETFKIFTPGLYPTISPSQAKAIQRFLKGTPGNLKPPDTK